MIIKIEMNEWMTEWREDSGRTDLAVRSSDVFDAGSLGGCCCCSSLTSTSFSGPKTKVLSGSADEKAARSSRLSTQSLKSYAAFGECWWGCWSCWSCWLDETSSIDIKNPLTSQTVSKHHQESTKRSVERFISKPEDCVMATTPAK